MTSGSLRLALAAGVVALAVPAAGASDLCAAFTAAGGSDGVRTAGRVPGFLLVEGGDASRATAQAVVTSTGTSQAYAAAAYSDGASGVLGLGGVDPDSLPLLAASDASSRPESAESTPAGSVAAKSAPLSSTGEATTGIGSPAAAVAGSSTARGTAGCRADGTVEAVGTSTSEALSFGGGVLRLGQVRSESRAVARPGARTTTTSDLLVSGASVLGQAVQVTPKGLVVGGTTTPVPAAPLTDALRGAGITLTWVAGSKDADGFGVVGPALQVTVARRAPVGTGDGTVTWTFGASYARARTSADPAGPEAADPPAAPAGTAPATGDAPSTDRPAAPASPPGEVPDVDAAAGAVDAGLGSAAPPPALAGPGQGPPPATDAAAAPALQPVASALLLGAPLLVLYPLLVLGAVVVVVGTRLFRSSGASRWT